MDDIPAAALDAALQTKSPWPFEPELEALYRARRGPARRWRQALGLRYLGWLTGCAPIIALFTGFVPFWRAGLLECGGALICLCAAAAIRRARHAWVERALYAIPVLISVATTLMLAQYAGHAADRYALAAIVIVFAELALTPVEMETAIITAAGSILIFPVSFLLMARALPFAQNWDIVLFNIGLCITGYSVARRMETVRKQNFLSGLRHERAEAEMRSLNSELWRLSNTDPLTGLCNRRNFDTELARLWRERQTLTSPLGTGLVLVDIDYFKRYNDAAGHQEGDVCLHEVATAIANTVRGERDHVARYGGEEFVVLLDRIAFEEVSSVGDRLREAVAALGIPHPGMPGRSVSVSVGVAWCPHAAHEITAETLLREADAALYAAKGAGRDTAVLTRLPAEPAGADQR